MAAASVLLPRAKSNAAAPSSSAMRISITKYVSATSSAAAIHGALRRGHPAVRVEQHRVRALDGVDELREEVRRDRVRERHAEFCAARPCRSKIRDRRRRAGARTRATAARRARRRRSANCSRNSARVMSSVCVGNFNARAVGHLESLVNALEVSCVIGSCSGGCSQGQHQYRRPHGEAQRSPGRAGAPLGARSAARARQSRSRD